MTDIHPHLPDMLHDFIRYVSKLVDVEVTTDPHPEIEGNAYSAYRLGLNGYHIVFRIAKQTPIKQGQFVTLWKRIGPGEPIVPFDSSDHISCFVIGVYKDHHKGYFIFPQPVLSAQGVLSCASQGGKRAMRVYPPWTRPTSQQAITTQQWQCTYFGDLSSPLKDTDWIRQLFQSVSG